MQLKRKVGLALLAALSLAAPAFAHVPARELAPSVDFLHAPPIADGPVQQLRIVPRDLFADVAHVETPPAWLSTTLAQRFDEQNIEAERPQTLHLTHAVRRNLTSGLHESLRGAIIREINGLGPETRWATGTARARWYDPKSGSWLTPDPLGYQDSSNLYAFASGDPVNGRDPRGEGEEQSARAGEMLSRDPVVQCMTGRVFGSLKATAKIGAGFVTGTIGLVRGAFGGGDPDAANEALDDAQDFVMHPVKRFFSVMDRVQKAEDAGDCMRAGETLHGEFTGPTTVAVVGTIGLLRNGGVEKPSVVRVELAKPSSGFARYVQAEKSISPVPTTLAEIEDQLRTNACCATTRAEATGVPKTNGRMGTKAHAFFETESITLNGVLREAPQGFGFGVEEFRDRLGRVVKRRARGSLGVDVIVYKGGVAIAGFDLKTGHSWSPAELAAIERRFGVTVTQINTKH